MARLFKGKHGEVGSLSRRSVLALGLCFGAGCRQTTPAPASEPSVSITAEEVLCRASDYLWSRQAEDGGWHSEVYGLLRSGQSLTGFVLDALLQIPDDLYPRSALSVERAVAFLSKHADSEGALGRTDPAIPDYPNYATALAVMALCRTDGGAGATEVVRVISYLRNQQLTEANGWKPSDSCYGAWGMGGAVQTPPNPGHVDLSMTRYVLQALAAAGTPPTNPAFQKAGVFLSRCQNYGPDTETRGDGGFFFSPVILGANKAGRNAAGFRSYGTATADGILSLLALCPRVGERIVSAQRYLVASHSDTNAPGFAGEARQRWAQGLRYYYAAASAEAFRKLGVYGFARVTPGLIAEQQADGNWTNPDNLVKEDDPLIATGFAIRAIVNEIGFEPGKPDFTSSLPVPNA